MFKFEITKTNKKKKEKTETSKIVVGSLIVLTYIFVIFVCVMVSLTLDLSILKVLIPSVFSLSTISVGFYSWKAKTENKIKLEILRIEMEEKLKKKYGNENIKIDTSIQEENKNNFNNFGTYNDFGDDSDGVG